MKVLKFLGFTLTILIVGAGIFFYKSSIPTGVVDARYSTRASQFLLMENGTRVHFRDEGKRRAETIVLIHGSVASLHTWEPWVKILGENYRVVTLDLPGHGLTGATPEGDYSNEAFIRTVDAVVKELGIPSFILGGNSMGGGVTWRYTLAYPEKVKAMLLIDASGPPAWWDELERASAGNGASAGKGDSADVNESVEKKDPPLIFTLLSKAWFRAISTKLDPYYLTKQGVLTAYNNSPVVTDELIMRYYKMALRQGTREATMKRFSNYGKDQQNYDLSVIQQPTLIIWGEEDTLIGLDMAEKFASILPNATLVTFPGVGHIPMEELPLETAMSAEKFLASLSDG